jgi:hypothetical protein
MFKIDEDKEFTALLPNLKFNNKDNKIYFISIDGIKIKKQGKEVINKTLLIGDLKQDSIIFYMDKRLECKIIQKEFEGGLKINIKLKSKDHIDQETKQKMARFIEAKILNIDMNDNLSDDESVDNNYYDNKINNYMKTNSERYSDVDEDAIDAAYAADNADNSDYDHYDN